MYMYNIYYIYQVSSYIRVVSQREVRMGIAVLEESCEGSFGGVFRMYINRS